MNSIIINSNAKINLFLDIVGKRDDGYHNIKTVMQEIDLHDTITIEQSEADTLSCSNYSIPTDDSNTCMKALRLIKQAYNIKENVKIHIDKNIPPEAGLAGGSSNAAAVIKGLNELWRLNMSREKMCEFGVRIGADVPFCVIGGTCLCEGIGEIVTELSPFICESILIIKPEFSISTPAAYKGVRAENYNSYADSHIIDYISDSDFENVCLSLANTLEDVVSAEYTGINAIKQSIIQQGAAASLMTGSGSAVYGLFNNSQTANSAFNELKKSYKSIFLCSTI